MTFEFRNCSYYRGNEKDGSFTSGYLVSDSIEGAANFLRKAYSYWDDYLSYNFVRATNYSLPLGVNFVISGSFISSKENGTGEFRFIRKPEWTHLPPKEFVKEGFLKC